jgi:glycosyltransferase involved in cell wall biosynthesis
VHNIPDFEVFAALIPRLTGSKVILDVHDILPEFFLSKFDYRTDSFLYKMLLLQERMSIRFAHHVIISNDLWRKKITQRSVSEEKCTTILNYTDTNIFYPRPREKYLDDYVLFYGGTLNYHQGIDIFIRAVSRVYKEHKNVKAHIYGEGAEMEALMALSEDLGLVGTVLFHGYVDIKEISYETTQSDLGIVPKRNSLFGGQAFSTKIMEFMAAEIPVVVSGTEIDRYYFSDGQVLFFEPENADDLAEKIMEVMNNAEIRKALVEKGREYMLLNRWQEKATLYLDIVDSVIGSGKTV